MAINTPKFHMGLTMYEGVSAFNTDKYIHIAGRNPLGLAMLDRIEKNWIQWVEKVEHSDWLRNWKRSPHYNKAGTSPAGASVEDYYKHSAVATTIFTLAVWGIGVDGWLRTPSKNNKHIHDAFHKAQGVTKPSAARTYDCDPVYYNCCGLFIPYELGELDRWIESVI